MSRNIYGLLRVLLAPLLFLAVYHATLCSRFDQARRHEWLFDPNWRAFHLYTYIALVLVAVTCQSFAMTMSLLSEENAWGAVVVLLVVLHVLAFADSNPRVKHLAEGYVLVLIG